MTESKKRIGFVEVPDEALDIVSHFSSLPDWEPALIMSAEADSYGARMARLLTIPYSSQISEEHLRRCEMVVLGSDSPELRQQVFDALAGTSTRIVGLQEVLDELGLDLDMPSITEHPAGQPGPPPPALEHHPSEPVGGSPASGNLDFEPSPGMTNFLAGLGEDSRQMETPQPAPPETDHQPSYTELSSPEVESTFGFEPPTEQEPISNAPEASPPSYEPPQEAEPQHEQPPQEVEPQHEQPPQGVEPHQQHDPPPASESALPSEIAPEETAHTEPIETADEETPPTTKILDIREAAGHPSSTISRDPIAEESSREEWEQASAEEVIHDADEVSGPTTSDSDSLTLVEPSRIMPSPFQDLKPETPESSVAETTSENGEPASSVPESAATSDESSGYRVFPPESVHAPAPGGAENASTEDETLPQFSLRALMGSNHQDDETTYRIDPHNRSLIRLLNRALEATGATTGSVMLPDAQPEHLRIAVSAGLSPHLVSTTRPRIGEGLAGEAFGKNEPRITQAKLPGFAETGGREPYRIAASVPIQVDGRPIGVLSVNIDALEKAYDEEILEPLREIAGRAPEALFAAIDLRSLPLETRFSMIQEQVDRIMSSEDGSPARLRAVCDLLRDAVSADYGHLFLIDPLEQRLQLISEDDGFATLSEKSQPLEQGFLGWVVLDGRHRILSISEDRNGKERWIGCFPVHSHRPYGLMVLENIAVQEGDGPALEKGLLDVIHQIEGMLEVEQGVESQDILTELTVRIADKASQLEILPPPLRIQPSLELAMQLLAAEAAVWIPFIGSRPISAQPKTRRAATLLAEAWDNLETLAEWTREHELVAVGATGVGWDENGPQGPGPYVGVKAKDGNGVLLVFYDTAQASGAAVQIPARVLSSALLRVADLIEAGGETDGDEEIPRGITLSAHVLSLQELSTHIHQEWVRTRQTGRAFTLTRFECSGRDSAKRTTMLRNYLLAHKRANDVLAEVRAGTFVILSADVDRVADAIVRRLSQGWEAEHPEVPLILDYVTCPQDGETEEYFQAWAVEGSKYKAA